MAVSRVGVGVATLNTNLYAVGGHDGRSYLNTVEVSEIDCTVKVSTWRILIVIPSTQSKLDVSLLCISIKWWVPL